MGSRCIDDKQQTFIRGGSAPRSNPLPLLRTMFGRKGTPFTYPIVYNFVSL